MEQKAKLYSNLEIISKISNLLIVIILFLVIQPTYRILIYSTIISLLITLVISFYWSRKYWSLKNLKIRDVKHSQKEILIYGSPFVITIFITWLFESMDKIAIRYWGDFEELGLYSAAFRIVTLVAVLRSTFSIFWTPVSYEKFNSDTDHQKFFQSIFNILALAMLSVGIFSIAAKDLIVILLGEDYKEATAIVPFLIFMPILYTISEVTVSGINFYKKTKWHIFIAVFSCTLNFFGNWLLVPLYGAVGAALSTAFAYLIFFILRTVISYKYFKIKYHLGRFFIMLSIVFTFATYSVSTKDILSNMLMGSLIFIILVFFYTKEIKNIYTNYFVK